MGRGREDSLVLDELQQLGHMVQVLSYELTVLQDFMKENYGSRFHFYRKKHLNSQQLSRSDVSTESRQLRKCSKIKVKATTQSYTDDGSDSVDQEDQDNDDSRTVILVAHHNKTDHKLSAMHMDEDVADASEERDPLGTDDVDDSISMDSDMSDSENCQTSDSHDKKPRHGPQSKSAIWKKFIVSKLANGKIQTKCRKCLNNVSSKVERLRNHYEKCVLGTSPKEKLSPEEVENKRKVRRLLRLSRPSATTESPRGGTRKLDEVWRYFQVENEGGKKTAICNICNSKVSCKVERVRKHFIQCNELVKDTRPESKGSGSESDDW